MKIFCLIATVILSFSSFSQKSYYFSDPVPSVAAKISAVDSKYFGVYASGTGLSYSIDESGISIVSTSISSMSRESIRESSKYDVRGGYIFGVVENDSIPCILEEDRYYFGIRNVDVFIGVGNSNVLTKTTSSSIYIVNQYENGNYTPMQLSFKGSKLTISYFEYDDETSNFNFIETQKSIPTQYNELIILSPTAEEFKTLEGKGIFAMGKTFKK